MPPTLRIHLASSYVLFVGEQLLKYVATNGAWQKGESMQTHERVARGNFHIKNKYYTAITKHFARYVSDGQIVASCMRPNEDLIPRLIQSTRNFFPDLAQPANLNITIV